MSKNKKKRWLIAGSIIVLLLAGILIVYALVTTTGLGHPYTEIIVSINNCNVTLQSAIDNTYITGLATPTKCLSKSQFPKTYHLASSILIVKDGFTMTLQEAVDNNVFADGATRSYTTQLPKGGHFANEVEIIIGTRMNLQDAINANSGGKFSCVNNYGNSCGFGDPICIIKTGTIDCAGNCVGAQYEPTTKSCGIKDCDTLDNTCRNYNDVTKYCDGNGNCADPTCNSYTNTAKGTNCGGDSKACDGAGSCLGWSGEGCGRCPFGSTSDYCKLNGNQGKYSEVATLFEQTVCADTGNCPGWSSWSYSTNAATCKREVCCGWQIFCWLGPQCSKDNKWMIKP